VDATSLVLTACTIGALLIYLVFSRNFVLGSEPGNWVYPYLVSPPSIPVSTVVIVLLALGLFVFLGNKLIQSYERITLSALFLSAILIQSLIRTIYPFSLGALVQSDRSGSFYTPAMSYSAAEILAKFSALAPFFPHHARSNMPGKILLFELFRLFTSSPEVMGFLIIAVSSLGALLLYGICKRIFHDKQIAFFALTLYVVMPSKLFFLHGLNAVTPVFMLLCFYLFVVYLDKRYAAIAWLLGISFYVLVLFEPSPLITGIVMIGIALHAINEKRLSNKDLYRLLLHASLAFLAMYILFYVIFSFNLFQSLLYVLDQAGKFNIRSQRGYLIWIIENSKEFFYGAGVPVMIIFIFMTMRIFAQRTNPARWPVESVYVISLLINFFVLLFLGINRGEVTRLWIYLATLFQVPASVFIARIGKGVILLFLVVSLLAIQGMVTLHRVRFGTP